MSTDCVNVLITPQGISGLNGIVGDLAWGTNEATFNNAENIGGFYIAKPFVASSLASGAICQIPATSTAVFTIYSATVTANVLTSVAIGTVTFAAGQYVGTVAITAPAINQYAVIYITAPPTADATLALVSITVASL